MCQHDYDNKEEEFMSEYTPEEEKHQALADVIMAKIFSDFQDDATEVMSILSKHIKKMADGDQDGECLIAVIDGAINAPYYNRHDPANRWIIDAIYLESLALAELNL